MLTVNEIFHSIQGESSHAGRPCVFVRLTACDLRCVWCDSALRLPRGGEAQPIDDVVAEVVAFGCPLVEVTGGEPLLQKDVYPLIERLHEAGHAGAGRDRRPPQHRRRARPRHRDHGREVSGQRGSGEARRRQLRPAAAARRGEVRHPRPRRLRLRARRRGARVAAPAGWRRSTSRPSTASSTRRRCRNGCWPTACRCACSSRCTSTSGAPTCAASDAQRVAACSTLLGRIRP